MAQKDRLQELCSKAVVETDPRKLQRLLEEINDILYATILAATRVVNATRSRPDWN